MENSNHIPSGDATNNAINNEKINEKKPVGYGSSIQSDGNGHRNRPIDEDKITRPSAGNEDEGEANAEIGHS